MALQWNKPNVEESMRLGYEVFAPEIEKQPEPTTLEVAAATLRIENPLSSWVESLNFQSNEEDVDAYDPYAELPDRYLPFTEDFLDIKSPDQSLMKQAQIDSQIKDRETMARGGAETIAWSLVAGLGDPINLPLMLVPGGAAVKAGIGAAKTAAVVAAGGVTEAALSETALHATQPTRTWQESMFAVGATALLGGALGGLAGAGSKRTMKALEDADKEIADIVQNGGPIDIDIVGTAGAQRVMGTLEEEGSELLGPGINPLIRLLKSDSTTARATTNRMLRHNFYNGKNKSLDADGNIQYKESTIPAEVEMNRLQQGMGGRYLRTINENHKAMRKAGTKLSKSKFQKQVGRAMRRGDAHEIPEVAATAKKIREDVINPITRGFQDLGDLPEDLKVKFAESYFPRLYNTRAINKDLNGWYTLLTEHFTSGETSRAEARLLAEDVTNKILSSPAGRLPQDIVGTTGRIKERLLDIPDVVMDEAGFLIDDVDRVMQAYLRSTTPELSLKKEFGDHELVGQIQAVKDEYMLLVDNAKTNKEKKVLRESMDKSVRDLMAVRDIMLGRYLPPVDRNKQLTNMAKTVRQLSFMANLGMMTISAIPDLARPIMQHGVRAWAGALPRSMLYWGKKTKLARTDLEDWGVGNDGVLNSRVYALSDIDDVGGGMEKVTRQFAKWSGVSLWTGAMKKVAAFTAQNRFITDSRNYAKLSSLRKERLAKAGINERMAKAIAEQSDEFGEKLGTSWHANTNDWTDREAANLFERVILKDVDTVIVTPGIADRPLFMSSEMGKTIFQFKSFFLAAHNQALLPMLQQMKRGDVAAFEGLFVGVGLGMMGEWIRLQLSGREGELAAYSTQDWARAGLDRSGIATVPMELFNISDRIMRGGLSQAMNLTEGSRYFYRNWAGTLLGPTFGYAKDIGVLGQNLVNSDGVTSRDIHSLRRLLPYQNMFYLRKGFDVMEEEMAKAAGVEPRKRKRSSRKKTSGYIK